MSQGEPTVYPYIPNSAPEVKRLMLEAVGAESTDDFFEDVPESLRLKGRMNLPEPLPSEEVKSIETLCVVEYSGLVQLELGAVSSTKGPSKLPDSGSLALSLLASSK